MTRHPTHWTERPASLFDRMIEDFFGSDSMFTAPALPAYAPALDVAERADAFVVTAEVPGVDAGDIGLEVANGVLTIRGEKKVERAEGGGEGARWVERRHGSFVRRVRLDPAIDAGKITAELRNGVLSVTLPKTESARPRKIEVRRQLESEAVEPKAIESRPGEAR